MATGNGVEVKVTQQVNERGTDRVGVGGILVPSNKRAQNGQKNHNFPTVANHPEKFIKCLFLIYLITKDATDRRQQYLVSRTNAT